MVVFSGDCKRKSQKSFIIKANEKQQQQWAKLRKINLLTSSSSLQQKNMMKMETDKIMDETNSNQPVSVVLIYIPYIFFFNNFPYFVVVSLFSVHFRAQIDV